MIREMARPAVGAPRGGLLVWTFVVFVVVWGNVASLVLGATAALPGGSAQYALAGLALVAISAAVARTLRLGVRDLGLAGPHARGAVVGAALGAGVAFAGVAALRIVAPLAVGGPVEYTPLAGVSGADLFRHAAVLLPLGVVLPEEIAFRGVLVGALVRSLGARTTTLVAAIAFALWHVWTLLVTVGDTTLGGSVWTAVGIVGALGVVAAGGALFTWLRLRTGTLATTMAAHWAFNVVVLVGLWSTR